MRKLCQVSVLPAAFLAISLAMPLQLKAETLADALASVQVGNAKIEAERARARGDSERIAQARSGFMPSMSATGDYGLMRSKNLVTGTTGATNPHSYGLAVSQPLFNGFKTLADYRKAQDETLAGYASLMNIEQQTMLYGAQAYMRVLRDRKILAMRHDNLRNLRISMEQAQGRFTAGDMTRTSVDQARSRMNEAEADVASSKADLADSEAYYRYIIGRQPSKLAVPSMSKVQLPCNLQDALIVGENENPTLQAARHTANAAGHGINSAKAAFYPSVSLEGSLKRGYDESRVSGAAGQDASLGIKVGVPIFNGGLDKSRVQQAKLVKTQRDLEVDDARNLVHRSVSSAWDSLKAVKMRKYAAVKRVSATEAALKGLMIEYGAGQIALINVLDGRREVINARVTYAMVENDETIAHFTLLAALGHLDMRVAQDLSQGRSYMAGGSCSSRPVAGEGRAFIQAGPAPVGVISSLAKKIDPAQPAPMLAKGEDKPVAQAVAAPRGAFGALMAFTKREEAPPQVAVIAQPVPQETAVTPKAIAAPVAKPASLPATKPLEVTAPHVAQTVTPQRTGAIGALMSLGSRQIDPAPVAAISAPANEKPNNGLPLPKR